MKERPILRWTKEPPTVQGYYYRRPRGSGGEADAIRRVDVAPVSGELYIDGLGSVFLSEVEFAHHEWSGPIPEPEEASDG